MVMNASENLGTEEKGLPPKVAIVSRETLLRFPHHKRVGNYLLGRTLGEGSFAKVREGMHTVTGEKVAIKVIDKRRAREDAYVSRNMRREGRLLQLARHRYVVQLLEVMETEHSYYLVTELCEGGDLMDLICARKRLSEAETRKFVRQIVSAVDHLHRQGIIHRDLKIENLLLDRNNDIKLIDFGLSNLVRDEMCVTQCGSPAYAAPELLGHKKYNHKVDIWSIGVNMYAMLTGSLPFTVEPFNIKALHAKMLRGEMNPVPEHLTADCKDLLSRLLTADPAKRVTLREIISHPWVIGEGEVAFLQEIIPRVELEERVVHYMTHGLGIRRSELIQALLGHQACSAAATYHLMFRRLLRHLAEERVKEEKENESESPKVAHVSRAPAPPPRRSPRTASEPPVPPPSTAGLSKDMDDIIRKYHRLRASTRHRHGEERRPLAGARRPFLQEPVIRPRRPKPIDLTLPAERPLKQ